MVFKKQTPQSAFIALFGFALVPWLLLLSRAVLLDPQALGWYVSGASDLFSTGGKDREAVLSDNRIRYVSIRSIEYLVR